MAKNLGTKSEYCLDPRTRAGTSYQANGVRYWNYFDDGTRELLQDWAAISQTVDIALATPDNVAGITYASEPPAPEDPNAAALRAGVRAQRAVEDLRAALRDGASYGVILTADGEQWVLPATLMAQIGT